MTTTNMAAEEYREARKALGLTQLQLANLLGVTPGTVSARERGEVAIDGEASIAMRRLLESKAVAR